MGVREEESSRRSWAAMQRISLLGWLASSLVGSDYAGLMPPDRPAGSRSRCCGFGQEMTYRLRLCALTSYRFTFLPRLRFASSQCFGDYNVLDELSPLGRCVGCTFFAAVFELIGKVEGNLLNLRRMAVAFFGAWASLSLLK